MTFQWDLRVQGIADSIESLIPNLPRSTRYEIATKAKRALVEMVTTDLRQLHTSEHTTGAFTREALLEQVEKIVRGE